jgi:hypothetical protein
MNVGELKTWEELTPYERWELFKQMDRLMRGDTVTIHERDHVWKDYWMTHREIDSTEEVFHIVVLQKII